MATLQDIVGQKLTQQQLQALGYNIQNSGAYGPSDVSSGYAGDLSISSGAQDWADQGGAWGAYTAGLTDNGDGTYTVGNNVGFNKLQKGEGWFADNLEWLGPLIVGGAALAGGLANPALYESGSLNASLDTAGNAGLDQGVTMNAMGDASTLAPVDVTEQAYQSGSMDAAMNGGQSFDMNNAMAFDDVSAPAAAETIDVNGVNPELSTQPETGFTPPDWVAPNNATPELNVGQAGSAVVPAATSAANSNLTNAVTTGAVAGGVGAVAGNVLGDTGSDWSKGVDTAMNSNTNGNTDTGSFLSLLNRALGTNLSASDLAKLFTSGAASYQNNQTANRLLDMFSRYNSDADYYGNLVKKSYEDPMSYFNSPQYQGIQNTTLDALQRKDAAGGGLANNFGRQAKLQDLASGQIKDYRSGLANLYTGMAGISTGQGAQAATMMSGTANSPLYSTINSLLSGTGT